ncbi:MAG: NAD-dependent epimerase/dehydratase family protein [Planctomycetota bacterium]
MMQRLVFGCGYLGERVARRWRAAGDEVFAVTRSSHAAERFVAEGWSPIIADVTNPLTLSDLPAADTVLFAVGYDRQAEATIEEVYAGGFASVLQALCEGVRRVVYISTTGVYGPASADGGWVDEKTPPAPVRDGGRASLAAEEHLRASRFAERGVALRLAGIYGPDRIPFVKQLRAGEPIAAPHTGNVNLIHVDDAATVTLAAANHPGPLPPVLCVSDGAPPVRGDYYREVARRIGAPEPAFVDPPAGSPKAARAAANKLVRNDLMRRTLGVELQYPHFRAGLAAVLGPPAEAAGNLGNEQPER